MSVKRSSARQPVGARLVGELRRMILTGEFEPGEVLVEPRLAERFGTSKTPAREALHILAAEGLLTVLPKKGYLVQTMTQQDLQEVLDLRMLLEPHAAAEAARLRNEQAVARLRTILESQREVSQNDPLAAMRTAREFHRVIAQTAQNSRLEAQLLRSLDETARAHYVIPDLQAHMSTAEELVEHERIVEAIAQGDVTAAERAMRVHLRTIRAVTIGKLDRRSGLWDESEGHA